MSIDTVVFDLGNVLVDWNPRYLYRKLIPDEPEMERFLAEVCTIPWHVRQDDTGKCAEATAALVAKFPDKRDLITAFYDRFDEMITGEVPGMAQIVMGLKARGMMVYGLTNWPGELFHHSKRFDILSHLDGIVVSGHEGVKKPEARLFQILFARYDIAPKRSLFIDDVAENVAAGIALGMHGHLFHDAERLRTALKGYHLL